ncbi:MAG: NAD(P)-dependent oxidoreductase [Gammaproteobacteria bacterium]
MLTGFFMGCRAAAVVAISLALVVGTAATASAASQELAPSADLAAALKEFQLQESSQPVRETMRGWSAPHKIVVTVDEPGRTAWLQQAMPKGVTVVGVPDEAAAGSQLADADALVYFGCNPGTFAKAPRAKWVHVASGGADQCLATPGIARGEILLTNGQKVKNTLMAEEAMGYVFALARSIDVGVRNQLRGELNSTGHGRRWKQLQGATMLIVGLGGAGVEIARIANAVGMKVIATRNSSREGPDFVSYVGLADETPKLVGEADVVVICAPLTPATRGLFNAAMFARMKKDAILVNWTRAEITVAEDLAAALKAGTIGSAALNWATSKPLPKDHPLWSAPNLILAPWGGTGMGGGTPLGSGTGTGTGPGSGVQANKATRAGGDSTRDARWLVVRENIRRFATGDKMYSVFDLERGY